MTTILPDHERYDQGSMTTILPDDGVPNESVGDVEQCLHEFDVPKGITTCPGVVGRRILSSVDGVVGHLYGVLSLVVGMPGLRRCRCLS